MLRRLTPCTETRTAADWSTATRLGDCATKPLCNTSATETSRCDLVSVNVCWQPVLRHLANYPRRCKRAIDQCRTDDALHKLSGRKSKHVARHGVHAQTPAQRACKTIADRRVRLSPTTQNTTRARSAHAGTRLPTRGWPWNLECFMKECQRCASNMNFSACDHIDSSPRSMEDRSAQFPAASATSCLQQ